MPISHLFLDWRRPLLEEAVDRLLPFAKGSQPADFGRIALVLPTAEAGRQLRAALLEKIFRGRRGGITGLRILTAEALLHPDDPEVREADESTVLVAWSAAIRRALEAGDGAYGDLFPGLVAAELRKETGLRIDAARRLQSARLELAGAGWSIAGALSRFDAACKENADEELEKRFCRFRELRELETLYRRELERRAPGAADPADTVLAAIASPKLPAEVERVIVIDCPHLGRGAVKLLKNLAIAVEIWINAPEETAEHFDEAGRPEPGFWHRRAFPVKPEEQLRLYLSPEAQAHKLYSFAAVPEPPTVFGVLDPEVANALRILSEIDPVEGHPVFYWPQPRPLALQPWSRLAQTLLELGGSDDPPVSTVEALFASENFRRYVCTQWPEEITDWPTVLKQFDTLRSESFAATLEILRSVCIRRPLRNLLSLCLGWRSEIRRADSPIDAVFQILRKIGSAAMEPEVRAAAAGDRAAAARLADGEVELSKLRRLAVEVRRAAGNDRVAAAALLKIRLADTVTAPPPPAAAIELVGFAELNWRRERSLVIAGFNEEFFHPSDGSDPLLPETARRLLGMTLADDWHAIDALRFGALCASCGPNLRLLSGKSSSHGDELRPPRLLLQLPKEALAARIGMLFTDSLLESGQNEMPVPPAPWLAPRRAEPPARMRITGFKSYLASPFRFYLDRVLRVEECDERAFEMDNLQFGTMVHAVLEAYAQAVLAAYGENAEGPKDEEEIRTFCFSALDEIAERQFGAGLGGGIPRLQLELMRDSLRYFAAAEAVHRAEGWRICCSERAVECSWQKFYCGAFTSVEPAGWRAGITLCGKIDRIDFRPGDPERKLPAEYMVIDYKTSAKGESPAKTHFRSPLRDPLYSVLGTPSAKKEKEWCDLQLPLYRRLLLGGAVENVVPAAGAKVTAAYFNLPLELTATGFAPFPELNEAAVSDSAMICADEVLRRIYHDKCFGPPDAPAYSSGGVESEYCFDDTTVLEPRDWHWEDRPEEEADDHE